MQVTKQTVGKSFLWSFAEQGGATVMSVVVQIVLARILAPEAFGIMAILLVFISILNSIAQSGLSMALIQKKDADKTSFSTAFWLSMALSAAMYALVFVAAPLVSDVYNMPDLTAYLRVLALTVFLDAFNSIQRACLQKNMQFKALFYTNISAAVLSGIAGIVAAFSGLGVWALIIQTTSQMLAACVVMLVQIPWRPSLHFSKDEARGLFGYGWKICVTGILQTLYTGLSELILGKACSATDLGYYSNGRKYPNGVLGALGNAIQNVMFPTFALLQDDKNAFQDAIRKALTIGSYVIVPSCLLAAVIAEPLIAILLTETWLPCTLVFQITCASHCFLMLQIVNLRAYMALGESGLYMKLQIIKIITGILLLCGVAIATKSIYWVSAATFIHAAFSALCVDAHPAKRLHGVGRLEQIKIVCPTAALAVFVSILTSLIGLLGLPYLPCMLLQIVVFAILFLGGSALLKLSGLSLTVQAIKSLM